MAMYPVEQPSSLKIRLDLGTEDGKAKTRSRTYSNVKVDATDQDVYDVANAITELQKHSVLDIIKQDYTSLS